MARSAPAGAGANGFGATIVAPGDPVPGASGADAVDCGGASARICAGAGAGLSKKECRSGPLLQSRHPAHRASPTLTSRFFIINAAFSCRGGARPCRPPAPQLSRISADSPQLSPYPRLQLVVRLDRPDDRLQMRSVVSRRAPGGMAL